MKLNFKFTKALFPSNTLKERILCEVSHKPQNTNDLVSNFLKTEGVTKQAVYKALRSLVREEIVIKQKRLIAINSVWLSQMTHFIMKSEGIVSSEKERTIFGPLFSKRQTTLRFKNTESLDTLNYETPFLC